MVSAALTLLTHVLAVACCQTSSKQRQKAQAFINWREEHRGPFWKVSGLQHATKVLLLLLLLLPPLNACAMDVP